MAAARLVDGRQGAIVDDGTPWDRRDVRALLRALAVVHGAEVEILVGVEAIGPSGDVVVATPNLDHVDRVVRSHRRHSPLGRPVPAPDRAGAWRGTGPLPRRLDAGVAGPTTLGPQGLPWAAHPAAGMIWLRVMRDVTSDIGEGRASDNANR